MPCLLALAPSCEVVECALERCDGEFEVFVLDGQGWREGEAVWESAGQEPGLACEDPKAGRGVGVAGGAEKGGYVATCAEVAADGDSLQVVRLVTAFECGAVVNPDHHTKS